MQATIVATLNRAGPFFLLLCSNNAAGFMRGISPDSRRVPNRSKAALNLHLMLPSTITSKPTNRTPASQQLNTKSGHTNLQNFTNQGPTNANTTSQNTSLLLAFSSKMHITQFRIVLKLPDDAFARRNGTSDDLSTANPALRPRETRIKKFLGFPPF